MSDLNKLRWQCRRGTLELDVLLQRYLERCYSQADEQERRAFLQLLKLEDGDLLRYLMGERPCDIAELQALVAKISALPV